MKNLILVISLALASIVHAADSTDTVLDRLAKVERFSFGGVGFAGIISPGEKDFRVILSRPSAKADFEKLLIIGNPQAKAYALVGMRVLDRKHFEQISRPLRNSTEEVVMESGCIVHQETFSTVLKQIDTGQYPFYDGNTQ